MDRAAAPSEHPERGSGAASPAAPAAPTSPPNATDPAAEERDRVRIEFYATYDVMTGVRIAATLGGFFALMVFLVVYKSRSKSVKALRDPKIVELAEAAVAEEEAFEEERQLTAALESALAERARSRPSLGEVPRWPRASPRFASVGGGGGYGALLAPPRRLSTVRGESLPASALRFDCRTYAEEAEYPPRRALGAPLRDRRLSSATCSSSGSSYLERRGSSAACSLPERRLSPCPSERDSAERLALAPLASVGSFGPSFAVECELASLGADSVFGEAEDAASTDDEVEQFSTDSGGGGGGGGGPPRPPRSPRSPRLLRIDSTEMSTRTMVSSPLDLDCATRSRETLF